MKFATKVAFSAASGLPLTLDKDTPSEGPEARPGQQSALSPEASSVASRAHGFCGVMKELSSVSRTFSKKLSILIPHKGLESRGAFPRRHCV